MFKNEAEYQMARTRIEADKQAAMRQREQFAAQGLTDQEIEEAMQPLLSFHAQLVDEVRWYERIVAGDFSSLEDLDALGRLLIAIRTARGISQEELARRLGVPVAQVIRDERDEYYGFTLQELSPIIRALKTRISTHVEVESEEQPQRGLVYVGD